MGATLEQVDAEIARRERLAAVDQEMQRRQMQTASDQSFLGRVKDNVIGVDDGVQSYGETAGDWIRGGTAAVARGIADIPALPANIAQLGVAGYEKVTGAEEPTAASQFLSGLPDTRDMLASVPVIGPESEYIAPGKAGEYISTAGEFAGGAAGGKNAVSLLRGGLNYGDDIVGTAVRYGALPGLASEGAGQLTEGTAAEPWARAITPVLASLILARQPQKFSKKGLANLDDEAVDNANALLKDGVRPSAGQAKDSATLMRLEGSQAPTSAQLEDFTAAALRTAGSTGRRATPRVLTKTSDNITDGMNAILDITDVPIPTTTGNRALDISAAYFDTTAGGHLPVKLRLVNEQLLDIATQPGNVSIPATRLREWRTSLGKLVTSADEGTRDAAHALRLVIDDATEDALRNLGREADIAKLADLRGKYRNFIAIADASSRGGRQGARGLLPPERMVTASKRIVGKMSYAKGRGTDLTELTRKAEGIIGQAPTVSAGGVRDIMSGALPATGGAGAGAYLGFQAGGPLGAIAGGTIGATLPVVGRGVINSGPVQSALVNPGNFVNALAATAPGTVSTGADLVQQNYLRGVAGR